MGIEDGIKKLARLARERGFVKYEEINDTFPDGAFSPEALDDVYVRLCDLKIEILERVGVDPDI